MISHISLTIRNPFVFARQPALGISCAPIPGLRSVSGHDDPRPPGPEVLPALPAPHPAGRGALVAVLLPRGLQGVEDG